MRTTNDGIVTGNNRTGIAVAKNRARELLDGARQSHPSAPGDERGVAEVRESYTADVEPIGSVPPPPLDDVDREAMLERKLAVFVDKLGERLAFERTGVRLYEALLSKAHALPMLEGGPTIEELEDFHAHELAHFAMLRSVAKKLRIDTTVVTPSADVASIIGMGLPHVLSDPRTSLRQCLDAILVAELCDNDGWTLLIELAEALGYDHEAERFEDALAQEQVHLTRVRAWVTDSALAVT